jgi:hypothetical protein
MGSLRNTRLRARPEWQRKALFLAYTSVVMVLMSLVVLILTPKIAFVGYACLAAAALEICSSGVIWMRAR